jgi:hypothetical protein
MSQCPVMKITRMDAQLAYLALQVESTLPRRADVEHQAGALTGPVGAAIQMVVGLPLVVAASVLLAVLEREVRTRALTPCGDGRCGRHECSFSTGRISGPAVTRCLCRRAQRR